MAASRQVVITGLGVVSPIGIGKEAFWSSLMEGRSGVRTLPRLCQAELPVTIGAELPDFDPKRYVRPRKSLKVMCREIQVGFSAAVLALEDGGIAPASLDPDRFGVVLASDLYFSDLPDFEDVFRNCLVERRFEFDRWGQRFMSDVYPLWLLRYLPNMTACHIAIANDARGPNNTLSVGEASSLLALIEAATVIQRGRADVMLAGGVGGRLHITSILYHGHADLSHHSEDPEAASRPFDALRDGMVIGEGGCVLVLESRDHAEARGATPLANILGYGVSFGNPRDSSLHAGRAFRHSIRKALQSAELSSGDIGHVNAHGLSTVKDDLIEAQAIRDCLGDTPVTALKSYFGNLGAGGGAVESAASVLALGAGKIPATRNYETPDPACPVNVICGQPLSADGGAALLLSQSHTGQTAAVVAAAP